MDPLLKYYTVQELHNWLVHNQLIEGLSNKIIAPQRAWAIIHNPYVRDTDVVLCAIFENDIPVAYTAAFPEWIESEQRLIWWFSTLYCHPSVQGKGYGLIVVGQLCALIGEGNFFDVDGAPETVSIFDYLGLKHHYVKRYAFTEKKICSDSFKGKIAYCLKYFRHLKINVMRSIVKTKIRYSNYRINYINHIDDFTYHFIKNHSIDDAFLRTQSMFNWILSYPFMKQIPLSNRLDKTLVFSSQVNMYCLQAVQVWVKNKLVGVFIYRIMDNKMSINYLYYIKQNEQEVFCAIIEHMIHTHSKELRTTNCILGEWLKKIKLTEKMQMEKFSFSYPDWFCNCNCQLQLGDGDAFV